MRQSSTGARAESVRPAAAPLDEGIFRTCVRNLVALTEVAVWWIDRPPAAIAESLRDLIVRMLRADAVYVQLRDPATRRLLVVSGCASEEELESALAAMADRNARDALLSRGANAPMPLATFRIGPDGEMGRFAVAARRPGFPDETEAIFLDAAASQIAIALRHSALVHPPRSTGLGHGRRRDATTASARGS